MVACWAPAAVEESLEHQRDDPEWSSNVVTVMMRRIPRHFTQQCLMREVIERGFEGLFDFLYLPWDLKKNQNVGYGFINFPDPRIALIFRDAFDGAHLGAGASGPKETHLRVHPASLQGYQANYHHFVNTKTGQKQDPLSSPLFFPGSGENALSTLLHAVGPGGGGQPTQAACDAGAGPNWKDVALAEAGVLGWEGLRGDGPGGEAQPGSSEEPARGRHGGARARRGGRGRREQAAR